MLKKLDSREQTKLALEEKLLGKKMSQGERKIDEETDLENNQALDSSVVKYDEGCCENSVPVLAL